MKTMRKQKKQMEFYVQLIFNIRHQLFSLFPDEEQLKQTILIPIQKLIHGLSSPLMDAITAIEVDQNMESGVGNGFRLLDAAQCSPQDCRKILLSSPFTSMGSVKMPCPTRLADILLLCRAKAAVPDESLWGILHQSLLSQDLHVLSVAAVTCSTDASAAQQLCGLMALARLTQILLEPLSTGIHRSFAAPLTVSSQPPDPAIKIGGSQDNDSTAAAMAHLRAAVCQVLSIDISYGPSGSELVRHVAEEWVPFLEFASCLQAVTGSAHSLPTFDPTADVIDQMDRLLSLLQLPVLSQLLVTPGLVRLSVAWAQQLQQQQRFVPLADAQERRIDYGSATSHRTDEQHAEAVEGTRRVEGRDTVSEDAIDAINFLIDLPIPDDYESRVVSTAAAAGRHRAGSGGMFGVLLAQLGLDPNMELTPELTALLEALSGTPAAGVETERAWRLTGVDPTLRYGDAFIGDTFSELDLTNVHSRAPLQASFTGHYSVNGINGQTVTEFLCDFSHFGQSVSRKGGLISLPQLYTDLYHMTKFPQGAGGVVLEDPCLCLVCGRVLDAGQRQGEPPMRHPGECTLHSRCCGAGIGLFFLVQRCCLLLIRGSHAIYSYSLYLDANGDAGDSSRGHNRPLYLSQRRLQKIEQLYLTHALPAELARRRATADRVVRQNWY